MTSAVAAAPSSRQPVRGVALATSIFLVALNLRAALAGLPPLIDTVQHDLGLSGAVAGLLTLVPVLCMGGCAPLAQLLARRVGRESTVSIALLFLLAGLVSRLAGDHLSVLFVGAALVGVGIALCGTVLPGIVKEFYSHRPGLMTGLYLLAMMVGATTASALAVPLATALGSWQRSLAVWALLAVAGLLAWAPVWWSARSGGRARAPVPEGDDTGRSLPWRSRTAWLLAGFLALQSFGFYSQLAWIPPTYVARGWSAGSAGLLLAAWSLVQLVSGVAGPVLADRVRDRRPLVAASVVAALLGVTGVAVLPDAAPVLWVLLMGLGQGGGFALGLVKLVDYAPSAAASARLSALVFLVSYSTASLGPLVFGAVHDWTGGFRASFVLLSLVSLVQLTLVPRLRPGRLAEPA
jgi:CP family cyanate transporter-like MFS transporter